MSTRTPRQRWTDAVWVSDLRPLERLVALAFAKHAGRGLDEVWVSWAELRRLTQLSNDAAARALTSLRDHGWLVKTAAPSGRKATRYRLSLPDSTPAGGAQGDAEGADLDSASTPLSDGCAPADGARSTPPDGEEPQRNHEGTTTYLPDDGAAPLVVLPGGRSDEVQSIDLAELLEAALTLWQEMRNVAEISFDAALTSLTDCLRWAVDVAADEQEDSDHAAFAASALARELDLDARLTGLDRRRLVRRMLSIPAERRFAVALAASEDGAPPEVRSAVAFLLTRIDRADPKFTQHERTAT